MEKSENGENCTLPNQCEDPCKNGEEQTNKGLKQGLYGYLPVIIALVGVAVLTLVLILLAIKAEQAGQEKSIETGQHLGEDVVATFVGGEINSGELREYINNSIYRDGKHRVCEKHGNDHSECTLDEDCESHPLNSVEAYRILLKQLVMKKMVDRWIRQKGMASKKDVKHRLKHLVEEINMERLAGEMHADKLKPDQIEMRQYYEEHREEYKDRPFSEAQKEIEGILLARKQAEYVPKYIEQLKANAVIERNYDLLQVAEPTEAQIKTHYETRRSEYVRPEFIRIQTLAIDAIAEEAGREKAAQALSKLRTGEDINNVAEEFTDDFSASTETVERGQKSKGFEQTVFRYYPGELTPVFKDGNFFYIAKILERGERILKPLEEVKEYVRAAVRRVMLEEKFNRNKYEALFSIHGKRFTVEQFQQEFSELSTAQQRQFASFDAKKNLLDQLIVKELLMEEFEDKGLEAERRKEIERLKEHALQQMLHKEEVDEKIKVNEEEARQFYDKLSPALQKHAFIEPAKARVSIIRMGTGFSDDERQRALKKIEEAQARLQAGEEFAQVAKEYSEDWTATRGGEMDQWIYEGGSHLGEFIEHRFHSLVFNLQPEEVSEVFTFSNSYWIVKMREHSPSRQQTFEEARPAIETYIEAKKHRERLIELQNELLEKSRLVIRDFVLSRLLQAETSRHKEEMSLY